MIIQPYGGLCNRLRVVLSARAKFGQIQVVWPLDGEIAGSHFLDVFEPLSDVEFIYDGSLGPSLRTCDPYLPMYPTSHDDVQPWQFAYRDLKLRPEHRLRWLAVRAGEGPYAAVHIRRSDHKCEPWVMPTTDDEFRAWIDAQDLPVYLATDSAEMQTKLRRNFMCLTAIQEHPDQDSGGRRNTTLADSAIDLFVCAGASAFMGTRCSSFSDHVTFLRRMGGWWS